MNAIAVVFADFVTANTGGPSQLMTELAGAPIVVHTLRRLCRVAGVEARCLLVNPRDTAAAQAAVTAAGCESQVTVLPLDVPPRPRRELLGTARKWNLASWRGGLLGATWYDEYLDLRALPLVFKHFGANVALCFDAHQPALDPALATQLLQHYAENAKSARSAFAVAPPGTAGVVLTAENVVDLCTMNIPFGLTLSYRPELAQPDPIISFSCCPTSPEVAQTAARLTGDTRASRELLAAAFATLGTDVSIEPLCAWVRQHSQTTRPPLPCEVDVELTTDDPLPASTVRPRGARVPARVLENLAALERVATELATYDDRLVALAGHGDPLAHPRFADVCGLLRTAGVYGIAVASPLVNPSAAAIEALFTHPVDVVEVLLDAATAETYRNVHGSDAFEAVVGLVRQLEQRRRSEPCARPIVTCSLTRCAATLPELEAFYDGWIRELGSAVLRGYSTYGGVLPADTLISTTPPIRRPCRRLAQRVTLLADGRAVLCDQDVAGAQVIGNWYEESLGAIWQGAAAEAARAAHTQLELESLPICASCDQWFRG